MRKAGLLPSISPEVKGFPGNPVPRFPGNIPPWLAGTFTKEIYLADTTSTCGGLTSKYLIEKVVSV